MLYEIKQYIFASRYKDVPKLSFSALENIIKSRISVKKNMFCSKTVDSWESERHW